MAVVAGRNRNNRPYFFTDVDGERVEFPSFGTGQGDLEGNQLREYTMYVRARQLDATEPEIAPENTAPPTITGTVQIGSVLTSTTGSWTGNPDPTYARQWKADGNDISGATAATYTIVADDVGAEITVEVTATNSAGSASVESEPVGPVPAIPPANTGLPVITGAAQVGETLTVSNGTWTGTPTPTFTYQWEADGDDISGATANTYVPVEDDVGAVITCTVTATNSGGSDSATSAGTDPVIEE